MKRSALLGELLSRGLEPWFTTVLVGPDGRLLEEIDVATVTMARDAARALRTRYRDVPAALAVYVLRGDVSLGLPELWGDDAAPGLPEGARVEILEVWRARSTTPLARTRRCWRAEALG